MPAKIYDWERWFKKRRFTVVKGVHYDCSQGTMGQQIRNAATKYGLKVSLVEEDRQITVLVLRRKVEDAVKEEEWVDV